LTYTRPSDIVTAEATWAVNSGTISSDPDYGLASLYDGKMAKPTKFTDSPAVNVRIVGNFGSARRIDGLALPNSKSIAAGTIMKAELNTVDSWISPAVSVDMVMGSPYLDGHVASPWASFLAASGYSVSGYQYASLLVPAGAAAPWLGELLVLAQLRTFSQWPGFSGTKGRTHPFLENIYTEYGQRRVVRRLIKQRRIDYPIKGSDQDVEDLQALADDCGGVSTPFFLAADGNVKIDGGLYGRLDPGLVASLMNPEEWFNVNGLTISFEEDSRSLPM